jgi:hypothetical protein
MSFPQFCQTNATALFEAKTAYTVPVHLTLPRLKLIPQAVNTGS